MNPALQSFADQTAAVCRDTYGDVRLWNESLDSRLTKVISEQQASDSERAAALAVAARFGEEVSSNLVESMLELFYDEAQSDVLRMRAIRAHDRLTAIAGNHVEFVVRSLFHDRTEFTEGYSTSLGYVDYFSGQTIEDEQLGDRDLWYLDAIFRKWPTLTALALSEVLSSDSTEMVRSMACHCLIALSGNHGAHDSLIALSRRLWNVLCATNECSEVQRGIVQQLYRSRTDLGVELWFDVARDKECASEAREEALHILYTRAEKNISMYWTDLITIATDTLAPLPVRTSAFHCLHHKQCILSIPECVAILHDEQESLTVKGTILSQSAWPPRDGLADRLCALIPTLPLNIRRVALNVLADEDPERHLALTTSYVTDNSYSPEWRGELAVTTAMAHSAEHVASVIRSYAAALSSDEEESLQFSDGLIRRSYPTKFNDENRVLLAAHELILPSADITRFLITKGRKVKENGDGWLAELLHLASVEQLLRGLRVFFSQKGVDLDVDELRSFVAIDLLNNVAVNGRPIKTPYWAAGSLEHKMKAEIRRIASKHARREFRVKNPQIDKVSRPLWNIDSMDLDSTAFPGPTHTKVLVCQVLARGSRGSIRPLFASWRCCVCLFAVSEGSG